MSDLAITEQNCFTSGYAGYPTAGPVVTYTYQNTGQTYDHRCNSIIIEDVVNNEIIYHWTKNDGVLVEAWTSGAVGNGGGNGGSGSSGSLSFEGMSNEDFQILWPALVGLMVAGFIVKQLRAVF